MKERTYQLSYPQTYLMERSRLQQEVDKLQALLATMVTLRMEGPGHILDTPEAQKLRVMNFKKLRNEYRAAAMCGLNVALNVWDRLYLEEDKETSGNG